MPGTPAARPPAAADPSAPKPRKKRTRDRWTDTTAEERKAIMRKVIDKRTANQRARRIAELVATAPPFSTEHVGLTVLLSGHPVADAPAPVPVAAPVPGSPPSAPAPRLPKRGALITGATGLLTPSLAGLTTTELGASMLVVALVIALSLIPAVPMLVCAYVWSRGALKAIRAAAKGDRKKSKDINSALADALRVLPPPLGGGTAHRPSRDDSPDEGKR
jgi:hypothetical protein